MTLAITSVKPEGLLQVENVLLQISDDETYVTSMSDPKGCQITLSEDPGAGVTVNQVAYTLSERTFTFHLEQDGGTAISDKDFFVTVYGRT